MKWKDKQVSLYTSHRDTGGRRRTLREVLFSDFGENISDIVKLRNLDRQAPDFETKKRELKNNLQCFALNELTNRQDVVTYSGLMQIDFDKKDCANFDIEQLKQAVFSLPFVCFVSLSCSGDGFYAIAAIAEPVKQKEYALNIFDVLGSYGLTCDRSKGRNYNDLRYVSYDQNMLWRDEVEPLRIKHFKPVCKPVTPVNQYVQHKTFNGNHGALIQSQINSIAGAQVGQRWHTVQAAAFTLGGISDGFNEIENAIYNNPAFSGQEQKYLKCARDCYQAGQKRPLTA